MRPSYYYVFAALILGWLAGSARAIDPVPSLRTLYFQDPAGGHDAAGPVAPPTPMVPAALPAGAVAAGTPAPGSAAPADPMGDNIAASQVAYEGKYGFVPPDHRDMLARCGVHFFADAGVYLMEPQFEGNPAFLASPLKGVGHAAPLPFHLDEFDYDLSFTPRATVGVANDSGWGLRTSWWFFDQNASTLVSHKTDPKHTLLFSSVAIPGVGGFTWPGPAAQQFNVFNNMLNFGSHLKLDVWDWEAFREVHAGAWCLLFSAGARYAHVSQNYDVTASNAGKGKLGTLSVNLLTDSQEVDADHHFDGFGPTGALDLHRPLGASGFAVYGTARTSVLFGHTKIGAFRQTVLIDQVVPLKGKATTARRTTFLSEETGEDDVLPVEEFEFGLEWAQALGRGRIFVRTGLVAQVWFDAGNATSPDGDLGFLGGALTAGIDY